MGDLIRILDKDGKDLGVRMTKDEVLLQKRSDFIIQQEELSDLHWMPIDQFDNEVHDEVLRSKYVPHGDYYDLVVSELKKRSKIDK